MARHERSAGFVVYHVLPGGSHEYLLLNYGRHWDFAKGHVEKGEDDLTAATRELREETGIADITSIPGFQQQVRYFFRDRKKGLIQKTVIFFLGRTQAGTGDIVISHEHEGFEFLPFDLAIKRITFPTARQVLRHAEETLLSRPAGPGGDSLSSAPANG
jgi:8-oxo-dGTP pyrophosphatase MutT (NUDIX family)